MPIDDPCVIRLGAEGACIQIHGHKEPDGTWRFIGVATHLDIEEDGNDSVRVGSIPWCSDLSKALPERSWIKFMPMYVHPELRAWFRDRYDAVVAAMHPYDREMYQSRLGTWQAFLASTPPDRWSDDRF